MSLFSIRRLPAHRAVTLITILAFSASVPLFAQAPPAREPGSPGGPNDVRVTDAGLVEMHVAGLPLATVLHMLSIEGRRNIVASPNVKGTVTASLYNLSIEEALDAILTPNGAGYKKTGNFVYVYTNEELARLSTGTGTNTRVYKLNYITATDAKAYLASIVGENGSITTSPPPATGIASGADDAGSESNAAQDFLVITARAEAHREIEQVLRQIDIRPRQVLIEATILRAELKDENALGIDFSIVGGVDLELLGATSQGIQNIQLGNLPQKRFEKFNAAAATGFTGDVPTGGLNIGIIKDQVAVFLRALEQVTDTNVLANPKVLALNKQKGQVIVGRRDGFLTTTVTETQAIQKVEFLETGTQLIFRPFIGDDGYVRVELHPEDSIGFVNAQGLPSEQTTEVTTNVLVKDGETILIGGLFRELTTDARNQIPALGNVPILGPLFRSNNDSTGREEVIILLTIHIVKDYAAYSAASEEVREDIERMRVGMRQGLMWHGRERIAQWHYRKAVEQVAQGCREKALWHVDLAIHNNGRFVAALELKERILQDRAWDEDGTGGRTFMHQLIAKERTERMVPFGRPLTDVKEVELPALAPIESGASDSP